MVDTAKNQQDAERQRSQQVRTPLLAVGQQAPDFELRTTPDQSVILSDFLGRPVVLVFYPADWSPVCGDQLALYNELHDEWRKHQAQLFGISVDSAWSHIAYSKDRKLRFPLLSDFEPKGQVSRRYGAYEQREGVSARALFVIDRSGIITWNYEAPIGINPGAEGILEALEDLPAREARKEQERAHA